MGVLRDLLMEASSNAGVPISDRDFISWYNEATSKLALTYNTAKSRATQSITCTDEKTEYSLTSGCIGIERCLDADGNNYKYFTVRGNVKILFASQGTFTLSLMFKPTKITDLTGSHTVPDAFIEAVKYYIVFMALKRSSKDKTVREDAQEAFSMFTLEGQAANNAIRNSSNKNRQVAVGRFR